MHFFPATKEPSGLQFGRCLWWECPNPDRMYLRSGVGFSGRYVFIESTPLANDPAAVGMPRLLGLVCLQPGDAPVDPTISEQSATPNVEGVILERAQRDEHQKGRIRE